LVLECDLLISIAVQTSSRAPIANRLDLIIFVVAQPRARLKGSSRACTFELSAATGEA